MLAYQSLILEGGGVKGIAYIGALKALDEHGITPQLTAFAGTSAGSIVAALLAAGYSHDELRTIMMELDFKKFEDGWNPLRLLTRYGLYKGDFFLDWMRDLLQQKLGEQPTFADLPRQLFVFATNLNTRSLAEFSPVMTPAVSVAEAVRCSMSIPLFFTAYELGGDLYVDGGVLLNYPFLPFETGSSDSVLGLRLDDLSRTGPERYPLGYHRIGLYVRGLFETMVSGQQEVEFDGDSVAQKQSVRINDMGISATDFKLTQAQKDQLYDNGYAATTAYLEARSGSTPTP